jgi:hypothetical protein
MTIRSKLLGEASHEDRHQPKWRSGNNDTSLEVRLLSAKTDQVIVSMPVYRTDTIRSQSFSLSQRVYPTWTSWLCFAPHPPTGFRPSECFPLSQP